MVITDLDSVKANGAGKLVACQVSQGDKTSNACLKSWYENSGITPTELLVADEAARTKVCCGSRISALKPRRVLRS